MKAFREFQSDDLDAATAQDEMKQHGYLLVRNALPQPETTKLLSALTAIMSEAGWLLDGHPAIDRIAAPHIASGNEDPVYKRVMNQVFQTQSLHAFMHRPALRRAMQRLTGPRLLVHPKAVARLIFPNAEQFLTHAHQDHQAVAGDPESYTAWMPLHDCPAELGPLRVLESSHLYGLQPTTAGGYVDKQSVRGGDWAQGEIRAGDILFFHSLTVHEATPNTSTQLRVSIDCRFQDYARPINPAGLVFPGGNKSWENTYANWTSEPDSESHSAALQFYWKRLPLRFKPTKAELAELAQTAETPEMRTRHARTLERFNEQWPD